MFDKDLVVLVGQVGLQSLLILEGNDEAVRESLGVVLGAHIGSPLVIGDGVDFRGKLGEGLFDGGHLVLAGVILELEADDVAVGTRGFFVVIGKRGRSHEGEGKGEGEENGFHF